MQDLNDITTYINDRNNGSSAWELVRVTNSSAVPLIANNSSGTSAIATFQDNGSTVWSVDDGGALTGTVVGPATPTKNALYKDNIVKAWVKFNGSTAAINDSFGVASVAKNSTGDYTISWANSFATAHYGIIATAMTAAGFNVVCTDSLNPPSTSSARVKVVRVSTEAAVDATEVYVLAIGEQ